MSCLSLPVLRPGLHQYFKRGSKERVMFQRGKFFYFLQGDILFPNIQTNEATEKNSKFRGEILNGADLAFLPAAAGQSKCGIVC